MGVVPELAVWGVRATHEGQAPLLSGGRLGLALSVLPSLSEFAPWDFWLEPGSLLHSLFRCWPLSQL